MALAGEGPIQARAGREAIDAPAEPFPGSPLEGKGSARTDGDAVLRDREAFYERELESRDRKVTELDRAFRAAVRDRELATALAGRPLVAGAVGQLIKLWRDDFDVFDEAGAVQVAGRDGRPVAAIIAERLDAAEYAHFRLPTTRGGAGARDANRPVTPSGPGPVPKNLGEAIVVQWRERAVATANDPRQPIGLGRRR